MTSFTATCDQPGTMPQHQLQDIDAKVDQVLHEVTDLLDRILAVLEKDEASRPMVVCNGT